METYRQDLAHIHDVGFGWFAENAGPGLLQLLKQHRIDDGLLVDLGCGSGIWAKQLVDAGYNVLGIDYSSDMIQIAKKRVPKARFQESSFLDADIPSCRAVTAIGEIFNYLSDKRNSKQYLRQTFTRIHNALQPNGLLIFDMTEPGYLRNFGSPHRHTEGDGWALLLDVEEDTKTQILTRRMVTFRKVGKLYRRDEEVHRLQLYRASEIAAELRAAGFRVRIVRGYGDFRFRKSMAGFVARKN